MPDSSQPTGPAFRPSADELLANNARYVESFDDSELGLAPRRQLAVVACMDSRMDIFQMLGLDHGDAHIIRNAGGVVTDDVIRSLVISQRLLDTREILLVHHTDCGLQKVREEEFKAELEAEVGIRPWWALESFRDPYSDVRQNMARLRNSPFIAHKEHVRGFVYHTDSGRLFEVLAEATEIPVPPAPAQGAAVSDGSR